MGDFCNHCRALIGQPTAIEPHEWLMRRVKTRRSDGDRERYCCSACSANLDRFSPNRKATGKVHRWTRVLVPATTASAQSDNSMVNRAWRR